ncbi:MAG: protein kinase [Armatimonadetes bacterium]|nr:protein kinase [Armatimonadota bacterium]
MINQTVDQRYEVLEKVGESDLFTVFRARDKSVNRMVALKLINPDFAQENGFARELMQGVKAAASLSHPNIAAIMELKPYENTGYVIVEYVRGINLKERIRRIAPFGLSAAVDFAISITESLNYVHAMGITHGDLRPQNIIISPEGIVKVTDFGTQTAIATSPKVQASVLPSSAPYHAPELSMAQKGTASGDIYGLGCLMYEMLTGSPPYSGESLEAIADQHAFASIPSVRVINPGVPKAVEGVILKCLQKKPADRYQSAGELLNDLQAIRDALRFGKSLSWSPIEPSKANTVPTRPPTEEVAAPTVVEQEAVSAIAASSEVTTMPEKSRAKPERISIYLRVGIAIAGSVVLILLIVIGGIAIAFWTVPKPITVPSMVGKTIEEVRDIAKKLDVRLQEHAEYSDTQTRNKVFKVDTDSGSEMRPKQLINVWYSRGSTYVDVPKLKGMTREVAEKKLKEVGLVLGSITMEHDEKVADGKIIRQADRHRVLHDAPIDVVISSGPKEVAPVPPPSDTTNGDRDGNRDGNTINGADGSSEVHEFNRVIRIGKDGLGRRHVRIEYEDYLGLHTAIEEEHEENEPVQLSFSYVGKKIKLRIFYNDKVAKELTIDPQKQTGKIE